MADPTPTRTPYQVRTIADDNLHSSNYPDLDAAVAAAAKASATAERFGIETRYRAVDTGDGGG